MAATTSVMRSRAEAGHLDEIVELIRDAGASCELVTPDGRTLALGDRSPEFRVVFKDERATRAPLNELAIASAYLRGEIDLEGDMMALFDIRDRLRDGVAPAQVLRYVTEFLFRSPQKVNSRAVDFHYTYGDDFFLTFIDKRYRFYSQCLFHTDDETLEEAAEHKLESMWSALELRPGMRVLDIGGGWGGVTEYCGARGVHVTSLTLSEDSANFIRRLISEKGIPGEVFLEDMLDHRPSRPYDHAVIYGVIEHIPNYRLFCNRLWDILEPGGRLYLDASAAKTKYSCSSFMKTFVYQGAHSFLAVQDIVQELLFHGFKVLEVRQETHDYELTLRHWAERLDAHRDEIVARWGEPLYRAFRLYLWGGCHSLKTDRVQAYHVVAERHADPGPRPGNLKRMGHFLLSLR